MWPWQRWSALHHERDECWFWQLRGGRLVGAHRPRGDSVTRLLDLGPATAFAVGCGAPARPKILLQHGRSGDRELDLVEVCRDSIARRTHVASGETEFLPHFLPQADPRSGWAPSWMTGRRIRVISEERELPQSLDEVHALIPTGRAVHWPWAFTGLGNDGAVIAGPLGWRSWEPWKMESGGVLLAPAGEGSSLSFVAAVPPRDGAGGLLFVRRTWCARASFWRGGGWSVPEVLARHRSATGPIWGAASGCPKDRAAYFWIDGRMQACMEEVNVDGHQKTSERLYLTESGRRLTALPVRVSGRFCPVGDAGTCFSHTWAVMRGNVEIAGGRLCAPEGWTFEMSMPAKARHSTSDRTGARLHAALAAAIREVDRLRAERDSLRRSAHLNDT